MYEYADQVVKYLTRKAIRLFTKAKSLTNFDELNVIEYSHELYDNLSTQARDAFLLIAKRAYEDTVAKWSDDENKADIDAAWLLGILDRYDPVTKYVFNQEIDRKRARFAESMIASETKAAEVETALRYWTSMIAQYAVEIEDEAVVEAYRDCGFKYVRWITEHDDRVCKVCDKRDYDVYPIDDIPPKPHIGCRCYLVPVEEE